jgi:hypothetical protein
VTTVFGGRDAGDPEGGYGVATQQVLEALAATGDALETDCLGTR